MIPFNKTIVYDDQTILLNRVSYPINELKKIIFKKVFEDNITPYNKNIFRNKSKYITSK